MTASLPLDGGSPVFHPEGEMKLPCGKCHICISKRASEWATRAKHEISEHTENSFITLTYEKLPSNFIVKEDFQKFMKRLRKKNPHKKLRYMVSYEYGTKNFRPHMHAIIFGHDFKNREYLTTTNSGSKLYRSEELEKLWPLGFSSIGEANEKTAYYIASYALKGTEKELYHPETGEWTQLRDSMNVSVRPAIGYNFFLKNYRQMLDTEIILPRYYRKKLEGLDPQAFLDYEDSLAEKIRNKTAREAYANIVINNQKASNSNSEQNFRQDFTDLAEKTRQFQTTRLKNDYRDYADYLRRKNEKSLHSKGSSK